MERAKPMQSRIAATLISATAIVMFAGAASAADIDEIIYAPDLPQTKPVEIGTGWYIRGDLGYATKATGSVDPFAGRSTKSEYSAGIGLGYRLNDFIRGDVTLEYMTGSFNSGGATCPGIVTGGCNSDFTGYSFMANAYADLGTFAGFTPYIGAGVGVTRMDWQNFKGNMETPRYEGNTTDRLTYAGMAGIAYNVTPNAKLDIGYRYLKVDGGTAYTLASGAGSSDSGLEKHEVRVGLRYEIW